jgi:hypothetical protein
MSSPDCSQVRCSASPRGGTSARFGASLPLLAAGSMLGLPLEPLSTRAVLVLATASPTIAAWVCTDHADHTDVRRATATVVALDALIVLLVVGLDASAFETIEHESAQTHVPSSGTGSRG